MERPINVNVAMSYLNATQWLLGLSYISMVIFLDHLQAPGSEIFTTIIAGVVALCIRWFFIVMIGKRRKWARNTFCVLFSFGILFSLVEWTESFQNLSSFPTFRIYILGLDALAMVLTLWALVLLFQEASSYWFMKRL